MTSSTIDGARTIGTVVITGAASGLGAAVARAVQQAGGTPLGLDVRACDGFDHAVVDVGDRQQVEAAVAGLADRAGGLDAVVTAAGIDRCGALLDVDADEWERVIGVNLLGTVSTVRACLPHLLRSSGRVVTVASTLGLRPASDATAYCASKFGVVGFTRALMLELAGAVGVTLLVPGGMSTAFFDDRDEQYKPGADAQLNQPSDVASAVVAALSQPRGCDIRELVMTPSKETSWP